MRALVRTGALILAGAAAIGCRAPSAPSTTDEPVLRVGDGVTTVAGLSLTFAELRSGVGPFRIVAPVGSSVRAVVFEDANADGERQPSEATLEFAANGTGPTFEVPRIRVREEQLSRFPPDRTQLGFEVREPGGRRHFRSVAVR